eukprot:TRINITY_DN47570_c0_g1_i1.p2 TRINITY_DN47570_c0_g1~~TRINITY_DN47570_c0_g1_i1.p2  ORF type:complete len:136 (+),score=63.07 TRINITY_DN47570_c0_g1_i1:56-409(+)
MGALSSAPAKVDTVELVREEVKRNVIVIFSGTRCVWCHRLRDLLQSNNMAHLSHTVLLDTHPQGNDFASGLFKITNQRTIPNVFIGGAHVGGFSEVQHLLQTGELQRILDAAPRQQA